MCKSHPMMYIYIRGYAVHVQLKMTKMQTMENELWRKMSSVVELMGHCTKPTAHIAVYLT